MVMPLLVGGVPLRSYTGLVIDVMLVRPLVFAGVVLVLSGPFRSAVITDEVPVAVPVSHGVPP